jgi:membrane protein implicated in regulation of membrane protease activity
MRERLIDRIPFAKIVIGLAIVLIVSLGLCGLTFVLSSGVGSNFASLGIIELVAMALSAAGLILTVVVWATLAAVRSFRDKVSQPQKLFEEGDDTKLDKKE